MEKTLHRKVSLIPESCVSNYPSRGHIIRTLAHVVPVRKLQVNAEETGIKTERKPRNHHKCLKFTTNAEELA
jgi:hypothetical protein